MKVLALALVLAAAPAVVSAQVAAAAIPNTFDRGAAQPAARPVAASPAVPAAPTAPANPKAEETLRAFIAGAQNDRIDYSVMTPDLAAKVREQGASVTQVVKGFGAIQAVDWMGQMEGADIFVVAFDNAPTEWLIGFTPEGKVAAILFRPQQQAAAPAPRPTS